MSMRQEEAEKTQTAEEDSVYISKGKTLLFFAIK